MAHRGRKNRGAPRGSTRAARGGLHSSLGRAANHDAPHSSLFSLRDEARNTESRHRLWSSNVKLRHLPVTFVSAGSMAGTKPDESSPETSDVEPLAKALAFSENAMAQMKLQPVADDATIADLISDTAVPTMATASSPPPLSFFEDTTGSKAPLDTRLPAPTVRSPSPTSSDSSEEVVLFRGRNHVKTVVESLPPSHVYNRTNTQPANKAGIPVTKSVAEAPCQPRNMPNGQNSILKSSSYKTKRGRGLEPDDEAIADYMENIKAQEEETGEPSYSTSTLTQRALALIDSNEGTERVSRQEFHKCTTGNPYKSDWGPAQLEDFDGISTSTEVPGAVDRILRKRERHSGTQYLVVFENTDEDEARWLPSTRLNQARDQSLITAFEETAANIILGNEISSSVSENYSEEGESDEEDEEDDEDADDAESFEDEKDLIERKMERMSDEAIARLLAKQEELGMGSDELLLFDDDDGDFDDALDGLGAGYNSFVTKPSRRNRQKSKRSRDNFPSASLMADVLEQDPYDGFDIMDFDRPSLRKKQKGRTKDLPFELSDEELAAELQSSWEADRKKKSLKKQEREELRTQGLLGKRNKFKPDLSARYNEGMTFSQIKEEIKAFLNAPHQSRAFPPMDKRDRAIVHQLGNAFNLNSKSVGAGKSRFTTLIKTSRTIEYDEAAFIQVSARFERRFLPRMDKSAMSGKRKAAGASGGGGRYTGVSYRDGDIVGASAPEIGAENKGRAMLEKMGWSSGTALGALNNKGILQPVAHIVKTTKAGLG